MIAVYKITNKQDKKFYIGASSNVDKRWKVHLQRYNKLTDKEFNKKLYQAMREFGVDNFEFDVLEECSLEDLFLKECRYIKNLNAIEDGYNEKSELDKHGRALLTLDDVLEIRISYKNLESKREVYKAYANKISEKGFHKVWNGYTWSSVMPEVFTEENKMFHKNNTGSIGQINPRTDLTDQDIIDIRTRKSNLEKMQVVFQDYSDRVTAGSFKNIWYGYNWKHIVI